MTYHDPCYLGRQSEPPLAWQGEERQTHGVMRYFTPPKPINYGVNGVFDAPRQVLRAIPGLQFVEMHRIREYAYCCGGGGGVPDAHPNVARSAAIQRVDEARDGRRRDAGHRLPALPPQPDALAGWDIHAGR